MVCIGKLHMDYFSGAKASALARGQMHTAGSFVVNAHLTSVQLGLHEHAGHSIEISRGVLKVCYHHITLCMQKIGCASSSLHHVGSGTKLDKAARAV